jgi:hypothetical protein
MFHRFHRCHRFTTHRAWPIGAPTRQSRRLVCVVQVARLVLPVSLATPRTAQLSVPVQPSTPQGRSLSSGFCQTRHEAAGPVAGTSQFQCRDTIHHIIPCRCAGVQVCRCAGVQVCKRVMLVPGTHIPYYTYYTYHGWSGHVRYTCTTCTVVSG